MEKITSFIQVRSYVIKRSDINGFSVKVSTRPYDKDDGTKLDHMSDENADVKDIYLILNMRDSSPLTVKYDTDRSLDSFVQFVREFFFPDTLGFVEDSIEEIELAGMVGELLFSAPIMEEENDNSKSGD